MNYLTVTSFASKTLKLKSILETFSVWLFTPKFCGFVHPQKKKFD